MKKKKGLAIVLTVVILAGIVAGAMVWRSHSMPKVSEALNTYTVGTGDVNVTITGSGMLESEDTYDISLPEGVKVETIFTEAGDMVERGDVMATLDASSLEARAAELSAELSELDDELGTRKTAGTIKAPVKGRIKYLPASEDDDVIEAVNEYGALAILSTDGLMQITLKTDLKLVLNADVTVKWNGGSEDGKVASRVDGGYVITLDDADVPYLAEAEVYYEASKIGSGTLEIHAPLAIFGNGGTIDSIEYGLDKRVESGNTLFTLDNEPATDSYRQTMSDRNEKAEQLQTILMYQNSPNVIADVSGAVCAVNVEEGKKTVSSDDSGEMIAFTVGTGGAVKMSVDVDELDIRHIEVGQTAEVTLDAFSTETFEAEVTRISHIGTASGSITTYDTDLILKPDERLMDGMNGSAVILSDSVHDVVTVPLDAVHEDAEGAYVLKVGVGGETTKAYIETGLSDGSRAEVLSGLNAGDIIVRSNQNSMMRQINERMAEQMGMNSEGDRS